MKLALHLLFDLAEVVFIFINQPVHMMVSVFIRLIELIVQQLTVIHTEAPGLTTSTYHLVDSVELVFRQLTAFKLGENDFYWLFVF